MSNERQIRYERREREKAADIGKIPAVVNPDRRAACKADLHKFLVTYYPASTGLSPFSADHEKVIARIQECILVGGRFVEAVYRGFAKTTILENAAQWAMLYGHRKFIAIFGADANAASGNMDSIKRELSENDLLFEDFPEVCHPIRALEGKPQRCASQTHIAGNVEGYTPSEDASSERTGIEWTADKIALPRVMMPDGWSAASGAVVTVRGITAGCRGMKHKRMDGTQQRPDFVFIDDPQTDESASSPAQVAKRLDTIKRSILQLGGHRNKIAVVMAATVIARDDLVSQLLDPKKHPSWQRDRIPMIKTWATVHESMWMDQYQRLRTLYDPDSEGDQQRAHAAATAFYATNREAMNAGCAVSWASCFDPVTELSAIQHAYNALIDDGSEVFASEFQNEPKEKEAEVSQLKADQVQAKAVGLARGIVPQFATHLSCFVDVQDNLLYAVVCAWGGGFRGHVVDYRAFPGQSRAYFAARDVKRGLAYTFPDAGKEGAIRAGLEAFAEQLLGSTWKREDGADMTVGCCMVDAGDGDHADIVYEFCRRSRFNHILKPSKGRYVGASSVAWEQYPKRTGETMGHHWLTAPLPKSPSTRLTHFDTNYWKTFIHSRWLAAVGDVGSLELCAGDHRMFAEHATAEYSVKTEGRGRMLTEWKLRAGRDNHLLDCLVGSAVGASIMGVSLTAAGMQTVRKRKRYTAADFAKLRAL